MLACVAAFARPLFASGVSLGAGFTTLVTSTTESKDLYDGLNYSAAIYFGKLTQLGLIADFGSLAAASTTSVLQSRSPIRYGLTLRKGFGSGTAMFEGGLAYASTGHFGVSAAGHLRLRLAKRYFFNLVGRYTYMLSAGEETTYFMPSAAIEHQF